MLLEHDTLSAMRTSHPAWRLLRADQAPLIAAFFHRVYIAPNQRLMPQADLVEALEDELFTLRERLGPDVYPKAAQEYLNDWAANDKGWLRKFYRQGSDEPHYDLMPATEKAITWLVGLAERSFVGTESRLLTLFELLKQMTEGSETDVERRLVELERRREAIDQEIAKVKEGNVTVLEDTALRDRFQQFTNLARELLSDFREVEHNFRSLDRQTRERIALWDGSKADLLEEIMQQRDRIAFSDQGRSFRAFWDFLMSSRRQEELTILLERALALPAVATLNPDPRTRRIHYDWLEAGEHTQRTVAQLSEQLRRFLDDTAWLENKRIIEILRSIEGRALTLSGQTISGDFISIEEPYADIELPMERPLYRPSVKPKINSRKIESGDDAIDATVLFSQVIVDKPAMVRHIRHCLQKEAQISLSRLIELKPLTHGLAELVTYLQLAGDTFRSTIDDEALETVYWSGDKAERKQATLPRVIFMR
ncbi:MAG: DUF3375 family protein [Cyanobacteria bacterium REEB67]|nr:DUF3375 family protein [Cyanobacteria bacterium REEB67]